MVNRDIKCSFCNTPYGSDGRKFIAGFVEPIVYICSVCVKDMKEKKKKDDIRDAME